MACELELFSFLLTLKIIEKYLNANPEKSGIGLRNKQPLKKCPRQIYKS
jgi:hypothetical protein